MRVVVFGAVLFAACKREPSNAAPAPSVAPVVSASAPKPAPLLRTCRDGVLVDESLGSGMANSGPIPTNDAGPFVVRSMVQRAVPLTPSTTSVAETPDALEERTCPLIREVRACAAAAREKSPALVGSLTLMATIAPAGRVADVRVRGGTLDDPSVEGCAIAALKKAAFAKAVDPWRLWWRVTVSPTHGRDRRVSMIEGEKQLPNARAAEVKARVRHAFPDFRDCYELALRRDPAVAGVVEIDFAVDGEGNTKSKVRSKKIADAAMTRCLEEAFDAITFAPAEPFEGKFPIEFVFDRP